MNKIRKRNIKRNDFIIKLGKSIAQIRDFKNLSQEKVANEIFISSTTLSRIENGTTDPRVSTLEKIAVALNVEPSDLFNETQNIHLDYPTELQEINKILRYEDQYTLSAIHEQIKFLLKFKSKK